MKIIKCHIENFGKISDASFDFTDGCNVIYENNGWGKSTLATFIKVMFYGFDGETKKKLVEKEREIFRPWQGGVYGGQLTFEVGGHVYTMIRTFGKKESDDEFVLKDDETNITVDKFSSHIGEELFKIDSESFKRTVYISQNDCITMTTDSINAKIGNLAENTDDINNYENVDNKLKDILNSMTPRRTTGSLNKLKKNIAELTEYVKEADNIDRSIFDVNKLCEDSRVTLDNLRNDKEELTRLQKKISEQKDVQVKRDRYNSIKTEFDARKDTYEEEKKYFPNNVPEEAELRDNMNRAASLDGLARSANMYEPTAEEEIRYEKYYREEFSEGDKLEKEIHSILNLWNSRNEKKAMLNTKKMEAVNSRTFIENSKKKSSNAGKLFLVAAVLFILGIGLTFVNLYLGITVIVLGVLCGVVGIIANSNKNDNSALPDETTLIQLENDIETDEKFIVNAENEVKLFLEKYSIMYSENEVVSQLYELSNLVKDCVMIHDKISKYGSAKDKYIDEKNCVCEFVKSLGKVPSDNLAEQLREIYDKHSKVKLSYEEFLKAKRIKEEFEENENVAELMKAIDVPEDASMEDIADKLNHIHQEMEGLNENILSYRKTLDDYRLKRDDISEKEIELEKLKLEYEEGNKKYSLIEKTKEFLGVAKVSFTSKYMQPIMSGFEKYYKMISRDNADAYSIDANTKLSVNEKGLPRDISTLSTGYQDMLGVCMRMALIDAMYKEEKPCIIFDDPFVNLDENKTDGGLEFLKNIACEYQVIYFTCHKSRV